MKNIFLQTPVTLGIVDVAVAVAVTAAVAVAFVVIVVDRLQIFIDRSYILQYLHLHPISKII